MIALGRALKEHAIEARAAKEAEPDGGAAVTTDGDPRRRTISASPDVAADGSEIA